MPNTYRSQQPNQSAGGVFNNPSRYLLYNSESRMSKERKKFLIVNVFDFVLCTLLWLLSAVTKPYKDAWLDAFLEEINIFLPRFLYNSLFDVAILSFLRMSLLLSVYAIIGCDHWIPVAFSTTATTIFIGIKIFYFFDKDKGSIQQYLVILSSLCIAWFELWLMPFRVLEREQQRQTVVEAQSVEENSIRQRLNAQELIRQIVASEEEFFHTAFEASSGEDEDRCKSISRIGKISRRKCKEAIVRAQNEADSLVSTVNSWKVLQKSSRNVPDIRFNDASNSYYIKTELGHTARAVFNAIWKESQKWNTQIVENRIIAVIDSATDIVITVTKASGGGYIAPRHFIDIRRFIATDDEKTYVGIYVSVEFAEETTASCGGGGEQEMKKGKSDGGAEVRGRNGVNMIRISQLAEKKALFEWVMNTDLRLAIPRVLIRRSITSFVVDYVRLLASFLDENPTGIK